jgi:hypothetical protein
MSLYDQWKKLIENQTDASFRSFWDKYCDAESRIYSSILQTPGETVRGTFRELADFYDVESVYFMGFLDGISTSLNNVQDIESMDGDSAVTLDIDVEKLYFNMRAAKAEHLFGLPVWDGVLTEERRAEIAKEQRKAGTVVKEQSPGRNDPCPCGSGKKYKKCCGARAGE